MADQITAFSERDIAGRERLEDFAADALIQTAGGLTLQIGIVCDGVGGGDVGERASYLATQVILQHIERSPQTYIPQLLIEAIEAANRAIYEELGGTGNTTVALVAIDVNDNAPYGRLYLASVGDSPIYIIRDERFIRLNTDHTVANEAFLNGQLSWGDAQQLENAHYLTRALGITYDVNVDIGLYAEKGKDFVPMADAQRKGRKGLLLKEGDTVFCSSDGMFDLNPADNRTFIHEEELIRHALDENPERAARMIISYASARRPQDNISISLIFVPSKRRKDRMVRGRLSRSQRAGLGVSAIVALLVIGILLVFVQQGTTELAVSQRTQTAQAVVQSNVQVTQTRQALVILSNQTAAFETQVIINITSTALAIPTFTPTPTPSPTPRPQRLSADAVGVQYFSSQPFSEVIAAQLFASADRSYVSVDGGEDITGVPASLFLLPDSEISIDRVDNITGRESIELVLYPKSDIYAEGGQYALGGVDVLWGPDINIQFHAEASCFSVKVLEPQAVNEPEKVAFTCYTNSTEECRYQFRRNEPVRIPGGARVVVDVTNRQELERGAVNPLEVEAYFDTIAALINEGRARESQCIVPIIDSDGDNFTISRDQCLDAAGPFDGCPDADGDGVLDKDDACPDRGNQGFGLGTDGCPLPPPDPDGDGVRGSADFCPNQIGPAANNGCPVPTLSP